MKKKIMIMIFMIVASFSFLTVSLNVVYAAGETITYVGTSSEPTEYLQHNETTDGYVELYLVSVDVEEAEATFVSNIFDWDVEGIGFTLFENTTQLDQDTSWKVDWHEWKVSVDLDVEYRFEVLGEVDGNKGGTAIITFTIDSPSTYTVSFDSNGGSSVSSEDVDDGEKATEPSDPTRTGYTFDGWYTDEDVWADEWVFTSDTVTEDITLHAKWTINEYTVTFDNNTVTHHTISNVDYGSTITAPSDPTETGYTFDAWYLEEFTPINKWNFTTDVVEGNLTLYAHYTVNEYTITFDSNEGSAVTAITEDFGASIDEPTAPTKAGMHFEGWYEDDTTFANPYSFTTMPAENLTLYAKWIYHVTFDSNDAHFTTAGIEYHEWESAVVGDYDAAESKGTVTLDTGWGYGDLENPNEVADGFVIRVDTGVGYDYAQIVRYSTIYEVDPNDNATEPADPSKPGYTFDGWYEEDSVWTTLWDTEQFNTMEITEDLQLYAKWAINEYTITFDSNGGSLVTAITEDYGTEVSAPIDPTRTGYTFDGWYSNELLTISFSFPHEITSDRTIYAKWTINEYTITFDSNGGSEVTAITEDYETVLSAPTSPTREGYTFDGWYDDEALTSSYTFMTMQAENITLYASWTINQYTITFDTNGGSAITAITEDYGTVLSEPDEPTKEGYTFAGWYAEAELTTLYTFTTMPASSFQLYAKWATGEYTITLVANGGSATDPIVQDYDTEVTAPDDPTREGHTFLGWYSDIELATEYVFDTMPGENITLYAKWQINSYTLTYDSNGGSIVAPAVYDYNEIITAPTAPTYEGYTFAGWFENAELTTEFIFTRMPSESMMLYAKWVIYEEPPTQSSSVDIGEVFLSYWWILPIGIGLIAIMSMMFSTKPKRRRYRRRY